MAGAEAERLHGLIKAGKNVTSLLSTSLNDGIVKQLKDSKTSFDGTLADCIRSGCENTDSGVGLYASDPDAYNTFAALFDPVIKDYHQVTELKHPACDYGGDLDKLNLTNPDPEGKFIKSTRVRVGRSHDSYGFPPVATCEQRVEMEKKASEALKKLDGDHKGTYHPLTGMSEATQNQLTEDHFLFNNKDRFLRSAGGYKDWPTGRGIFYNDKKTFLVWVNEEDHLRLISMQQGGDLKEVFARLVKGIIKLEGSGLSFARNEKLGYLTFCPTNLGTTLRASVHICIPKLSQTPDFKAFCDKHNIQARGVDGEHTASVGGVYDISNKRRLGLTEIQAIQEMYNGVKAVIDEEKKLQGK